MTYSPALVTGLGCVSSCGLTVTENLDTLFGNPVLPELPRRFSCDHEKEYPVFEVPEAFFECYPRRPDLFDTSLFALCAAQEAFKTAGFTIENLQSCRVGICIGTTVGASLNFLEYYKAYRSGGITNHRYIQRYLDSNPAQFLSAHLGLNGPVQTVVNACSSGTDAIGIGASWIQQGLCDVVLAGGADELTPITYNGFISLQISSNSPCRPFDENRTGLNLGEGAGILVLESADHITMRGANSLGCVLGYGTCADAYHLTAPKPDGAGLRVAIEDAMQRSRITAKDIGFINLHGTATSNNDTTEACALSALFPDTLLSATKGYTGHTLGAAGALEAVFTLECLRRGEIPASQGCEVPDSSFAVIPVRKQTKVKTNAAMSQSLAFGGNNSALIFGRTDS